MTEFKTFPQLLLEHARGLIGVMLLAYGLNFLLLATYFISDGWNGVESVLLLISFLILFPVVYWVFIYRYTIGRVLLSIYLLLQTELRMVFDGITLEILTRYANRASEEDEGAIAFYRLGNLVVARFEKIPPVIKRRLQNKLDEVPLSGFFKDIRKDQLHPDHAPQVSEKVFVRVDEYLMDNVFPQKKTFLKWLVPINLLAFFLTWYLIS